MARGYTNLHEEDEGFLYNLEIARYHTVPQLDSMDYQDKPRLGEADPPPVLSEAASLLVTEALRELRAELRAEFAALEERIRKLIDERAPPRGTVPDLPPMRIVELLVLGLSLLTYRSNLPKDEDPILLFLQGCKHRLEGLSPSSSDSSLWALLSFFLLMVWVPYALSW